MGSSEAASINQDVPDFEPVERMVVTDLRQLRIMANRLHCEIIEEITPAAQTVAEVGAALGIATSKLYYHFRELTEAGLIYCVTPDGVTRYRRYRAAAHYYQLSSQMLLPDSDARNHQAGIEFLAGAIENSARSLRRSFAHGVNGQSTTNVLVQRRFIQISAGRTTEFRDRLLDLAHEFVAMDDPEGDMTLELAVALFPRASSPAGGARAVSERTRRSKDTKLRSKSG